MKYNLIIPSAGEGKRFVKSGYEIYKPLIEVFRKQMICHVVEQFPNELGVIIIAADSKKLEFEKLKQYPNCKIVFVEDHKNGPAFSINQISLLLKSDEAYFVAYNDIVWEWDFQMVFNFISSNNPDGIIFTHKGFHPHLYKNNFSAFCKVSANRVVEVREKGSFTNDWMNESLSVGVFYFKSGDLLKTSIADILATNNRAANEFYPSVAFNYLIDRGLQIDLYDVSNFIHWGLPEQLDDVLHWKRVFTVQNEPNENLVCMMMCGTGERMKVVSDINKAGLNLDGRKMFDYVLHQYNSNNNLLIVNDAVAEIVESDFQTVNIHKQTPTQTASLKAAIPELRDLKSVLFTSNDCFGTIDYEDLKSKNDADIVIFGFAPSLLQQKQDSAHTYFETSGEFVSKILIKEKSDIGFGLAGMFYIPDCKIFDYLKDIDVLQNPSFDHFVKFLLDSEKNIKFTQIHDYVHLGTPEEYNEFLFWQKYYEK